MGVSPRARRYRKRFTTHWRRNDGDKDRRARVQWLGLGARSGGIIAHPGTSWNGEACRGFAGRARSLRRDREASYPVKMELERRSVRIVLMVGLVSSALPGD